MNKPLRRAAVLLLLSVLTALLFLFPASAAVIPSQEQPAASDATQGEEVPSQVEDSLFSGEVGGGPSVSSGTREPNINVNINGESSDSVKIVLLMTVVSLLPSFLLMMTCFTRIIIVFSLLRNALGIQQTPPNQVLVGLALFLTLFIMNPVITEINETAYKPYSDGELSTTEFLDTAKAPIKTFMLKQTKQEDVNLFLSLSGRGQPESLEDCTMDVVVPAFMTSEIKRGFTIGFLIFIPFLMIDMIVASALMSMGMMMLPPVTISLPFKLMLFVLVDGWGLMIRMLVSTYNL